MILFEEISRWTIKICLCRLINLPLTWYLIDNTYPDDNSNNQDSNFLEPLPTNQQSLSEGLLVNEVVNYADDTPMGSERRKKI